MPPPDGTIFQDGKYCLVGGAFPIGQFCTVHYFTRRTFGWKYCQLATAPTGLGLVFFRFLPDNGVITATMSGNNAIALVAGQKVTLKFSGSQFVSVSVDASVVNALISNKLLINAGSGQVIIGANAAQNLIKI